MKKTTCLGEVRPNANNTLAITLTLDKEKAAKILEDGKLGVGLVICTAEKRAQLGR